MNMHLVDWIILAAVVTGVSVVAYSTKRYTRSVADFLAANRCAGKYLLGPVAASEDIVASTDATHHTYIIAALERGPDRIQDATYVLESEQPGAA